ncbi:zf-RVT domain-containing protein, partial [Cephalotus follicularis]
LQVCLPKEEGGLGLRRTSECNNAALMSLLWDILSNKHSLWVSWCKLEILKGRTLWQVDPQQSLSVTWKSLLRLRTLFATNLVYTIGHNSSWSLWHDPWFQSIPLRDRLGNRAIYDSGLSTDATISRVQHGSLWNWPLHVMCPFGCGQQETIDHLFFECGYTKTVWSKVMELNNCPPPVAWNWDNTVTWALGHATGRRFQRWMRKAGIAAAVYHCWRERNNRI